MKLLLSLGHNKTKVVEHVTRAEQFGDFHQVFEANSDGEMAAPQATVKPRYWLIHSSDLKKPVRCYGIEVVQNGKAVDEAKAD